MIGRNLRKKRTRKHHLFSQYTAHLRRNFLPPPLPSFEEDSPAIAADSYHHFLCCKRRYGKKHDGSSLLWKAVEVLRLRAWPHERILHCRCSHMQWVMCQ